MKTKKIGRFDAYFPDRRPIDLILGIICLSAPKRGTTFNSPVPELHSFFYRMKEKYPEIFEDIYFNNDPDFPYSRELAECFIKLQEYGYVTRPNPSLTVYRADCDLDRVREKMTDQIFNFDKIEEIAEKFKEFFQVQKDRACVC